MENIQVLTIHRNTDRHDSVRSILSNQSFEFVYGLDLTILYPECKTIQDLPDSFFEKYNIHKESVLGYTKGQLGAYTAIRNMILNSVEKKNDLTIFFEDDFYPIEKDWLNLFKSALEQLPDDWDILLLGYNYDGLTYRLSYNRGLRFITRFVDFVKLITKRNPICIIPRKYSKNLDYSGVCNGGHAYCISKKGASLLKKHLEPMKMAGDILVSSLIQEKEIKAFSVYPCLFLQNPLFESKTRLTI